MKKLLTTRDTDWNPWNVWVIPKYRDSNFWFPFLKSTTNLDFKEHWSWKHQNRQCLDVSVLLATTYMWSDSRILLDIRLQEKVCSLLRLLHWPLQHSNLKMESRNLKLLTKWLRLRFLDNKLPRLQTSTGMMMSFRAPLSFIISPCMVRMGSHKG